MKPGGDLNGEEFPFASANPRIIRIVTGYDTREAALNAANVAQAVRRTLPAEYELLCRFWRFDVLQIPSAANMAIAEANAADVIICSTL
ncbi:MAG TPA: hypothetical protein VHH73_08855, partial [Verrucomicrobiae bacterium]|nr:hypothetical protein [Verrucomicrobiae bacterium]